MGDVKGNVGRGENRCIGRGERVDMEEREPRERGEQVYRESKKGKIKET